MAKAKDYADWCMAAAKKDAEAAQKEQDRLEADWHFAVKQYDEFMSYNRNNAKKREDAGYWRADMKRKERKANEAREPNAEKNAAAYVKEVAANHYKKWAMKAEERCEMEAKDAHVELKLAEWAESAKKRCGDASRGGRGGEGALQYCAQYANYEGMHRECCAKQCEHERANDRNACISACNHH